jgi:hypothetical protein
MRQSANYNGWHPSRGHEPKLLGGEDQSLAVSPRGSRALRLRHRKRPHIFSAGACPYFHHEDADFQITHKTYTVSSSRSNLHQ